MSDDDLCVEVVDELLSEPAARRSKIHVSALNGTVTLSGQVSSFTEKQSLDGAVKRVPGVKALFTQISIKRREGSALDMK